ncbi:hypothetical protein [Aurantimonas coralicida]|nr:hypothetical protein [Aurantimonas coralicida]
MSAPADPLLAVIGFAMVATVMGGLCFSVAATLRNLKASGERHDR